MDNQQSSRQSAYQRMFKRLLQQRALLPQKPMMAERIIASYKVYGWLIQHDPVYESTAFKREVLVAIDEIFDIVMAILDMMKCSSNLLVPIIIYADKFVHRSGIKHNQLFNLLLTSTVVTLKFWSESTQVNNAIIAEIFKFSLKYINLMERRFLTGVEYNLFLTADDVNTYVLSLYEHQYTFFAMFKHPFESAPHLLRKPLELLQFQQQMLLKQQEMILLQQQQQQQQLQALQYHSQTSSASPSSADSSPVYQADAYAQSLYQPNRMVSPMC